MTDYLIIIEESTAKSSPTELATRLAARATYAEHLAATGALLDAGRLRPSSEGKRVRHVAGAVRVDDGPFDDALESYYLIRAADLAAATGIASDCPLGPDATLELRPLMKGQAVPGKLDQPGKVFAFSVLGHAADEATWSEVMDRIDDDTKDKFPKDIVVGGMRLHAPTTGKRIVVDKSKRRVIDGPFLESKEVIGGLFFMRLASLDEAVQWASETDFVVHGALEIRELWRT